MYTNGLLEEKQRAQRALAEKAARQSKSYAQVVEEEAKELLRAQGRRLVFSRRKGEWPHARAAAAKVK
ncbi:hypothetical protein FJY63_03400 [Candidatus Sumerlaeota bacterium]|nr:hypothetical protein [Candidatus Sumerlaeota bacterium]